MGAIGIAHRQLREGTARQEMLERHVVVRTFVFHGADHRALAIGVAGDGDAGLCAQRAAPAVGGGLNQHPGAAGGAEILSDTQGVDFGPYMQRVIHETYRTWDPLIPEEVNPPILKRGVVDIVFTILPNGRVAPHSMILVGRSGDVALDRAAWGAIQGADFPPLPRQFHGPFLQLRFRFQYNVQ